MRRAGGEADGLGCDDSVRGENSRKHSNHVAKEVDLRATLGLGGMAGPVPCAGTHRNPKIALVAIGFVIVRTWLPDPVVLLRAFARAGALKRQAELNAANLAASPQSSRGLGPDEPQ